MRKSLGLSILCVLALVLAGNACSTATGSPAAGSGWAMKGTWTDSCCCKVSCPCMFGTKPTEGFCQGASLLEIESGHHGGVNLDHTTAVVTYHSGSWTRIYVDDSATDDQMEAFAALLPKAIPFLAKGEVESLGKARVTVERSGERVMYSVDETTVELEPLPGADGNPIHLENLPAKGLPFPELHDHTQYKSIRLEHDSGDHQFSWSGRNGFSSKVDVSGS